MCIEMLKNAQNKALVILFEVINLLLLHCLSCAKLFQSHKLFSYRSHNVCRDTSYQLVNFVITFLIQECSLFYTVL